MRKTTMTKKTKKITKRVTKQSLPKMLEKTQRVFNSYIRSRDSGIPCISCGREGNQAMYRIGLVEKIGLKAVSELEAKAIGDRIKKWSIDELNKIINKYKI